MNGTFMVSLDFELFWGMLDVCALEDYQDNVLGGKKAIPQLLKLFEKYGIHATFNPHSGCWAPEGKVYAPGTIHRRMPKSQVEKLYKNPNHEVAAHCLTHASLPVLSPAEVAHEVLADREGGFGSTGSN